VLQQIFGNIDTIKLALYIMGQGMLGIFIFMMIFYALILVLGRIFKLEAKK
jgi:hypothetical protein